MAHRVEVEVRLLLHIEIDIGVENRLLVEHRPGEHGSGRIDDEAATAHQHVAARHLLLDRVIFGKRVARQVLAGRQHEGAALERDVRHGCLPRRAVICSRRTVELDALRVHRLPHERHVVLPADDRAHAAERRVHGVERRSVAEAPHESLGARRHQLAVLADETLVGRDQQRRAVQRVAESLDDADHEVHAVLGRSFDQPPHLFAFERHGSVEVPAELLAASRRPHADHGTEGRALRVAADERLREDGELGTSCRRLCDETDGLAGGCIRIERNGSGLHYCDSAHGLILSGFGQPCEMSTPLVSFSIGQRMAIEKIPTAMT